MKMYSRPKPNKMKEMADAVDAMVEEVEPEKKTSKPRRASYKRRMSGVKTGKYSSDA
jgi:hypothetical protein